MITSETIPAAAIPAAFFEHPTTHRNPGMDETADRLRAKNTGDLLRVKLTEVRGSDNANEMNRLQGAMKTRKLSITAKVLGSHVYFILRAPQPASPAKTK